MKYYLINLSFVFFLGIIFTSCSDLETNIPQPQSVSLHKTGFASPSSENFHGKVIRNSNWNMKECQQCHAADFSGGITNVSCNNCHTAPGGPLACNTCHGDFKNPDKIAPPRDINGDTSTTIVGVGAHSKHLYDNTIGNKVACSTCHIVPQNVYDAGHLDSGLPAEVNLTGLAKANIAANASYNHADATCSNTYCHGNFEFTKASAPEENQFIYTADKMTGLNKTVKWNQVDGTQDKCGSCHGLPPEGHIQVPITTCSLCHQGVVDDEGNIIDKTKHINGVVNARGN